MNNHNYEHNLSGWKKAMADAGVTASSIPLDDKLRDLLRLINSSLPTYHHYFTDTSSFDPSYPQLETLSERNSALVARFIPSSSGGQRKTLVGVTLDEITKAVEDQTRPHIVVINEYDPAEYSGIILSLGKFAMAEVVKSPNLDALTHGRTVPWTANFSETLGHRLMRHQQSTPVNVRCVMWNAIRHISTCIDPYGIPKYELLPGYFEFVKSAKSGRIYFIDYKVDHPVPSNWTLSI